MFVGTGPSGQVVDLTDPEHPAAAPDRGVQYIWDLAADPKGNLYAATGPSGQLWKRSADGKWSLLLDSRHSHLLCVAVGPDGAVYAGSDGEGLIYRVAPDGKASVVYDAPQSEIRTLRFGPDGALYAGTAAEAGGGGGSGRGSVGFLQRRSGRVGRLRHVRRPARGPPRSVEVPKKAEVAPSRSTAPATPAGGSALPRPVTSGDNSVYRIDADGVPREIFRVKALIYALAWQGDRLLVGTGPEGQLYEVRDLGQESAPIARLDNGQVLALLEEPAGDLLVGTGDPGAVVRLDAGPRANAGRFVSDVHDTKLISRFGALSWRAERPAGTSVASPGPHRQRRRARRHLVGLVERTDRPAECAWRSSRPAGSSSTAPRSRPATPPSRPSCARWRSATSRRTCLPRSTRSTSPTSAPADGATRQTRLTLRWDVTDPNGDDLNYTVQVRKEGWPDWVPLGDQPADRDELRLGHDRRPGGALPGPARPRATGPRTTPTTP